MENLNDEQSQELAIPLYYEIYQQDLLHDYIDLKLLGTARTIEEARMCCKLFREALETAHTRDLPDMRSRATVFFRPVLKGQNNGT